MLVSMEMIYKELQQVNKKLQQLLDRENEHSIEEISLSKACKLLHKGDYAIKQLVKSKELKAIIARDTNGRTRYRFRIADIFQYQKSSSSFTDNKRFESLETAKEIAKRVFNSE